MKKMDEQTKKDMLGIYFTVDISDVYVLVEEIPVNWGNSPQAVEYNHMVEQLVAEWLVDEPEDVFAMCSCSINQDVVDATNRYSPSLMDLLPRRSEEKPVELGWWEKVKGFWNRRWRIRKKCAHCSNDMDDCEDGDICGYCHLVG